jgi:hypothetical protein
VLSYLAAHRLALGELAQTLKLRERIARNSHTQQQMAHVRPPLTSHLRGMSRALGDSPYKTRARVPLVLFGPSAPRRYPTSELSVLTRMRDHEAEV